MGAAVIDGAAVRRARAQLVERTDLTGRGLARRLADQIDGTFAILAAALPGDWSLFATGGYAAGLLCPGSDIDVVLVHPPRASTSEIEAVTNVLWYPIWDAGLKLSPAVHSQRSLMDLAAGDIVTATSLLRLRHLAGGREPVDTVQSAAREQWRKRGGRWLAELREITEQRWAKTGEAASLLEPDLKDGKGGLRDHDTLRWALATERPEVIEAADEPFSELATPADTILAVRCEMQRLSGKSTNVLLLQDQDAVAAAMGFADADVLMRRVAAAARAIEWASERFWWRYERSRQRAKRGAARAPVELSRGIFAADGEVTVTIGNAGDDQSLPLRVAAAAAHAGLPISRQSLVALCATSTGVGEPWTERTRQALVSLLGAGEHVVPTVEALERNELFSRLLPEWRAVRSLPQRNAFHTYTVDRHLLQTVANAADAVRDVSRPDLLLVGALLHDIGKGYPGDHTEVGVELVGAIAPRLGFDEADSAVLVSLVEHHLLLAETATRRDLSDPRTIETVARLVGDRVRLELLRALTEADSKATGPSAWSRWKEALLDELCAAVAASLAGQEIASRPAIPEYEVGDLLDAVRADGRVHARHHSEGDFEVWLVASHDVPGLFAKITGAFALHGIDVVTAAAWADVDGIALDRFQVRAQSEAPDWERVERDLHGVIAGTVDIGGRLAQRIRTYSRAHRRAYSATPPRLEVIISNDASAATTMIDVRAPDAIAVLHRLASALAELQLDIRSAKVATLGHEVVDVFYVQRAAAAGGAAQVPEPEHDVIRERLKAALVGA